MAYVKIVHYTPGLSIIARVVQQMRAVVLHTGRTGKMALVDSLARSTRMPKAMHPTVSPTSLRQLLHQMAMLQPRSNPVMLPREKSMATKPKLAGNSNTSRSDATTDKSFRLKELASTAVLTLGQRQMAEAVLHRTAPTNKGYSQTAPVRTAHLTQMP